MCIGRSRSSLSPSGGSPLLRFLIIIAMVIRAYVRCYELLVKELDVGTALFSLDYFSICRPASFLAVQSNLSTSRIVSLGVDSLRRTRSGDAS